MLKNESLLIISFGKHKKISLYAKGMLIKLSFDKEQLCAIF